MGRQIAIVMSRQDEKEFLSFLRASAPIQLYASFAKTILDLAVSDFSDLSERHWQYHVHNLDFEWTPEYATVGELAVDPAMIGWAYVANKSTAPVLEIDRADIARHRPGRLYWARDFSAPRGLSYDADAFNKWIDAVWRWCRSHGRKQPAGDTWAPYVFPHAWTQWMEMSPDAPQPEGRSHATR